jgi:hypothetical protein
MSPAAVPWTGYEYTDEDDDSTGYVTSDDE